MQPLSPNAVRYAADPGDPTDDEEQRATDLDNRLVELKSAVIWLFPCADRYHDN
jgi:hypothetical protein